jgi:DNA-binding protein Fis
MKSGLYWEALHKMERALLPSVLEIAGSRTKAAEILGLDRHTLSAKLAAIQQQPHPVENMIRELVSTRQVLG